MSELDVGTILRAGGLAPADATAPAGLRTGAVAARAYAHPALPGRVVVRLATDAIAPGVDVEMSTLGFAEPAVSPAVALAPERALGFPGWALVNDPGHARFALEVMKEFKKAAARAKSKPGHARDAFVELAARLGRSVPHFLPSFWEEAGRVFLAEGAATMAAQCFEKARLGEAEHALAIDEEVRGATFLEFALAGAVGVKTLGAYAKVLVAKLGPAEGYERFYELVRRRTLGGMPPWTGMGKELRALAKAAGKDVAAEDRRLLLDLLPAKALERAPAELWSTYGKTLVALARERPEARDRLRWLFPKPSSDTKEFAPTWLALLDEAGALDAVVQTSGVEASREAHGLAAEWLEKLLEFAAFEPAVAAIVGRMAPRLVAEGVPVQAAQGNRWWKQLALDVVEACLAAGVPLAPLPERLRFDLRRPFSCDPVLAAADPRFAALLASAVGDEVGKAEFEARAKGKTGFVAARRAWLARTLAKAGDGALLDLGKAVGVLEERADAALFAEFPEERAALGTLSVASALARTLRGGVFAELAWPAFEEVVAELDATTIHGAFPYAVVSNAARAIVVGPAGRVLEHDLRLPPKTKEIREAVYVPDEAGGQLRIMFHDPAAGYRMLWSGQPDETFDAEWGGVERAIPLPGGGLSCGGRAFHVGDRKVDLKAGVLFDGATYYALTHESGHLVAAPIDPRSGQKGAPRWPDRIAATLAPGLRVLQVTLEPLPAGLAGSALGDADGLVGSWVLHADTDRTKGGTFDVTGACLPTSPDATVASGFVRWPGTDARRPVWSAGYRLDMLVLDEEHRLLASVAPGHWGARGWKVVPPFRFWHYLVPRDPAGSEALRAVSDATVEALLAAARSERPDAKGAPAVTAAVAEQLSAITSPALREGVVAAVVHAGELAAKLATLVADRTGAAPALALNGPGDDALREALAGVVGRQWGYGEVSRELAQVSLAFEGQGTVTEDSRIGWEHFASSVRGLAVFALGALLAPEKRRTILDFLRVWKDTVLARRPEAIRVLVGTLSDASPFFRSEGGRPLGTWMASDGASRYFTRVLNVSNQLTAGTPRPTRIVELSEDGVFRLPPGFALQEEQRPRSGDAAWLETFLALADARGAPPFAVVEAEALAAATGMTRPEATLLWARLPNVDEWGQNFLDKAARETLGIALGDAKVARETWKALPAEQRLALFTAAAPDEPALLWTPLAAGGPIERLGAAWVAKAGRRVTLREDIVALVDKGVDLPHATVAVLEALVAPAAAAMLRPPATDAALAKVWEYEHRRPVPADRFTPQVVMSVALLLPFLFGELPVGDPYRTALGPLVEALRACLTDPRVLLPVLDTYGDGKDLPPLFEAIGAAPVEADDGLVRDDGVVRAWIHPGGTQIHVAVRPAKAGPLLAQPLLWKLHAASPYRPDPELSAAAFLEAAGPAFLARLAATPVPEGGYEANPGLSAPEIVAEIAAKYTLSASAATLYAQVLALAEPTQKRVLAWNGWKPAAYEKAAAELVGKKLVVPGKRERAGREIFLPGGWEKKANGPDLPTESWKEPLYALPHGAFGRRIAPRPLHELFAAAWARVTSGDVPKFEEV